jgi:hypothetical protein
MVGEHAGALGVVLGVAPPVGEEAPFCLERALFDGEAAAAGLAGEVGLGLALAEALERLAF